VPDNELRQVGDIGEYITEKIVEIAGDAGYNRQEEETAFKTTFDYLSRSLGDDSFRRYDPARGRFLGAFVISAFEFIALGIGANYQHYSANADPNLVVERAKEVWSDEDFRGHVGSGVRASSRIPYTIPLGRTRFAS
jgi:hypothetical protein